MKKFLDYTLIEFGSYQLTVAAVVGLLIIVLATMLMLFLVRKAIYRSKRIDVGKKYSFYSIVKYLALVITLLLCFDTLGINLSVLLAGSAALLVGVGLGLQALFSDFVSGVILLVERTVKINDILEVDGLVCQVQDIKLRTTTVLTRDDKYIILPNTVLTKNQLINWTHSEVDARFEIKVGVDYSSDVKLVMNLLKEAVTKQGGVLENPEPFIRFSDYGDSALQFSIYFWTNEVFRVENIKSDIRVRVFEMFSENKISIPFPQRVVHLKK